MEIQKILSSLRDDTTLVAVSKTRPATAIREAYASGLRHFGENQVQELLKKYEELQDLSLCWHLIGPLQTNKIKKILGKVALFHALGSLKLYRAIVKASENAGEPLPCLIQINISEEESKSGFLPDEVREAVSCIQEEASPFCPILGLMCIGSSRECSSDEKVGAEFSHMKLLFDEFSQQETSSFAMKYLSMGMSSDFELALEAGSNLVRIGSSLFGRREAYGQ